MYYMSDSSQQIYTQGSTIQIIAQTVNSYNSLIQKEDSFRLDLETADGQEAFRAYMDNIQALIKAIDINIKSRDYRQEYTKAYRLLYNEPGLGYIPQIFDAAQQAYQCIWVNGESYQFRQQIIEKGQKLIESYFRLVQLIRLINLHTEAKSYNIPIAYQIQLKQKLIEFDDCWTQYERIYINQLIGIQNKAKETIIQAFEIQKNLTDFENQQKLKGKIFFTASKQFNQNRKLLCEKIASFNSVANISGKGRDDLTYEILVAAENILTKITDSQSKSLRTVAEKIRESFNKIRDVLKNYSVNIQSVDPQLRNNPDLVDALMEYEINWEKGKRYFLQQKKQSQILAFSRILQASKEKYPNFRQLLEYSDPSVFWMIVSVVVLSSLQGEDQGIAQSFLNQLKPESSLRSQYDSLRKQYYIWKNSQSSLKQRQLYNQLEKRLVSDDRKDDENSTMGMATRIKQFAINLERLNPLDWNQMLGVLLVDEQ